MLYEMTDAGDVHIHDTGYGLVFCTDCTPVHDDFLSCIGPNFIVTADDPGVAVGGPAVGVSVASGVGVAVGVAVAVVVTMAICPFGNFVVTPGPLPGP